MCLGPYHIAEDKDFQTKTLPEPMPSASIEYNSEVHYVQNRSTLPRPIFIKKIVVASTENNVFTKPLLEQDVESPDSTLPPLQFSSSFITIIILYLVP